LVSSSSTGTPVAEFILLHPGIHFKPVKGDALFADPDLCEVGADFRIEAISIHAQIERGIPQPDQPGDELGMRDSGILWLGQVPENWRVKRMRFATRKIEQGWSPQCENQPADDDSWAVMKVGCVNGDQFDVDENKALPLDLEPKTEYELRPKDILISRANTKALLGSAAIVPVDVRSKLLLCDKLFRVSPEADIDEQFLTFYLRTPAARFQYEREATGASGSMQNISQDTIKDLVIVVPPRNEQELIVQTVREQVKKLDNLITIATAVVDRLTEYRTALITAATTGKIDVRGIKIPN